MHRRPARRCAAIGPAALTNAPPPPRTTTTTTTSDSHTPPLPPALAGELQEPSKKSIVRLVEAQDQLVENAKNGTDGEGQQR